MAIIGFLGDIKFQVSEETVLTLTQWKWSGAAKYATHERHNGNALTECTGQDTDKISFTIQLLRDLGVDPMEQLTKLWEYKRDATTLPLTVGTHAYGRYRWTITDLDIDLKRADYQGDIQVADVSLSLLEYLKE